jgi:hypothetical protein
LKVVKSHNPLRRRILRQVLALPVAGVVRADGLPTGWDPSREQQTGDLAMPFEEIEIDPKEVYKLSAGGTRAAFEPRAANFPDLLATTALQFDKQSRQNARQLISEMLELFNLPFEDPKTGKPLPYCASGISYIAALTYLNARQVSKRLSAMRTLLPDLDHYHFFPSPSVWDMYYVAMGKRRWIPVKQMTPKKGWLVIYDFGKGADHVGLVLDATDKEIHTFECNTSGVVNGSQFNGGLITTKSRSYQSVKGYVRTDLDIPV